MTSLLQPFIDFFRSLLEAIHGILPSVMLPWGWAISIIILTVIVRMILLPLTIKQYTSMRAMQKIQPLMKEIQKKYKDDKAKLNEEMMKLYREHKVNPFGSCLPILIQLPITIALYYMIKNQPFDTDNAFFWINNINNPDLILVVIYIGSQIASSALLATTTDKSQRILMMAMPLVFGLIIIRFPAGALLFWTTSNILMVAQQLAVREVIVSRESRAEQAVDSKKSGGKDEAKSKPKPPAVDVKKSGGTDEGKSKPKPKPRPRKKRR